MCVEPSRRTQDPFGSMSRAGLECMQVKGKIGGENPIVNRRLPLKPHVGLTPPLNVTP